MTPTSPNQTSRRLVASDEAAMLTALLPSRSAPISLSRAAISWLTLAASPSPCRWSRSMRAREEAMRAVSLPAKKNESSRQPRTAASANQSSITICLAEYCLKKGSDLTRIDIGCDEARADGVRQDEREAAALHLLVLGHELHQAVDCGSSAGNVAGPGRQADRGKMCGDARRLGGRDQAKPCRKRKREHDPQRHRLTVQQTVGESRCGFESMAE